jgi:integrase
MEGKMPAQKRFKTDYPGVTFIIGVSIATDKPEKIYMIRYRKDGKMIEEKAGRQFQDAMTPSKAARIRAERIEGKSLSNKERREVKEREKQAKLAKQWTLTNLWEEYKTTRADTKGIMSDNGRFKLHIEPTLGEKKFQDIAPLDLDRLRISLLKKKSPQTVKHVIGIIKRLSNFAINKRLCKGLDFRPTAPKVNNLKTEFLSDDQLKTLLKAIDEDPHPYAGPMMKMALFTGMRRGELFKLTWNAVDFNRSFITIKDPKGGVDQTIPLNENAREVLKALPKTESPFVFPGRGGGERTDINQQIKVIKERAGLPKDFRALHGLRHHYASMLASSGKVDMYVLQKLLTHKSPVMTQRYAHLRDEALKRASNLAGELVKEAITKADKEEKSDNVIPLR